MWQKCWDEELETMCRLILKLYIGLEEPFNEVRGFWQPHLFPRQPYSAFMVTLKTERLALREFTMDDYEAAHAYASDPLIVEYMSFGPNTPEDTRRFLERAIEKQRQRPRTGYTLALTIEGEVIGGCGITITDAKLGRGEIGYCMRPEYWSRGLGTEAAGALIRFGFEELGLHRIVAKCDPMNVASWRVMERNGMRREGRLRENVKIRGEWRDSLLYSILEHEHIG